MKVLFDITHASHVNMFKYVIQKIKDDNEVYLIGLKRGRIPQIMENDLLDYKDMKFIGKWKKNKFSIIFQANMFRAILIFFYALKIKPDVGISSGSIPFSFALRLIGKPVYDYSDDPERKFVSKLETLLCTKKYYPPFVHSDHHKISNYNCLKQWGYLHPSYFIPQIKVLKDYKLEVKQYIFIREVTTASLNYSDQKAGMILSFAKDLPSKYKVVFSLENKEDRSKYPEDWILLKEPVDNIHSLIYFSRYLISSGDSMAREGAILGVPSIYCGTRTMGANQIMIDKGMLFKKDSTEVVDELNRIDEKYSAIYQSEFREELKASWDDLNEFIINKSKII